MGMGERRQGKAGQGRAGIDGCGNQQKVSFEKSTIPGRLVTGSSP